MWVYCQHAKNLYRNKKRKSDKGECGFIVNMPKIYTEIKNNVYLDIYGVVMMGSLEYLVSLYKAIT